MKYLTSEISVAGVRVHLRQAGQGRPVLYLHGAGGVVESLPFFETMAADHELLLPDHPGFGRSEDPKWIRNIPDLAMFYLDLLDELNLPGGVDVVGHSIGGWLAAEIAIRNNTRIRSLTLISPAGLRVKGLPMGDPFIWSPAEHARNIYYDEAFAERLLAQKPSDEDLDRMIKNRYSFAKHAWYPRLFNPELEKWLHRVKRPTQIIWGREDKLIPAGYAALWKDKTHASAVTVIPRCGHSPMVEKGDEVALQIRNFIHKGTA